jgi:hypothetical protein
MGLEQEAQRGDREEQTHFPVSLACGVLKKVVYIDCPLVVRTLLLLVAIIARLSTKR